MDNGVVNNDGPDNVEQDQEQDNMDWENEHEGADNAADPLGNAEEHQIDDDEEEDVHVGQEEEEEDDVDDPLPRNADGSLDGGVAVPPETNKQNAADCDLMLFLECKEAVDGHENHPVLSPGVTVCIGLDKSTKLGAVFARYIQFCNEHTQRSDGALLGEDDVEFVHCLVLDQNETAENAALMRNDRVKVQKSRKDDRAMNENSRDDQREADRNYFENMRNLMPDLLGSCDTLLDCQGKIGGNQGVLRTTLRGHSAILTKRCKWLGTVISTAREEMERKSVITVPDGDNNFKEEAYNLPNHVVPPVPESDDGDEGIDALPYPAEARRNNDTVQGATEIENDDDVDDDQSIAGISRSGSPIFSSNSGTSLLWVTIPNHSPEAVKILLEYCYTNRVICLGRDAFNVASNPLKGENSAAPPRSTTWADKECSPTLSFTVALNAIVLAEEADLPRLSLMCEVAASNLLESSNVVDAFSLCTQQQERNGTELKRLRKAAMNHVFRRRGVETLGRSQSFMRALGDTDRSSVLVPSLLLGITEAVTAKDKKTDDFQVIKRELSRQTYEWFPEQDSEDHRAREKERKKYRSFTRASYAIPAEAATSSKSAFGGKLAAKKSSKRLHSSSHRNRHGRRHKKSSRGDGKWNFKKKR